MAEFKSVPVTLITGYLGSGKTTLLNNMLNNKKGHKIAVIVNDIGEVNIDADLIQEGGIVNTKDESLVPLQNGCICCTLKEDLIQQICSLIEKQKFDHIVIEASGICEPIPIAQTIVAIGEMCLANNMPKICHLDAIVSVVDAKRLADEFDCGETLTKQNSDEDWESPVLHWLGFCKVIVLQRRGEVAFENLQKVKSVIKRIQPVAKIIETDYAKLDIDEVLDVNLFDFEKVAGSAGWIMEMEKDDNENELIDEEDCDKHHDKECHCDKTENCDCDNDEECDCDDEHCHCHHDEDCHCHHDDEDCCHDHHHKDEEDHHHKHHHCHHDGETEEYGIVTYVYHRREPMDQKKFAEFCEKDWGRKIIRTKGLVYFKNNIDMCYLFESAGKQKTLTENGKWWASMPKDMLNKYMAEQPELFTKWDETYGDREVKLVFIGQNLDKKLLKETLDNI